MGDRPASDLFNAAIEAAWRTVGAVHAFGRPERSFDPFRTARRLFAERRRRGQRLPPSLFGEPAWDLLLALYIARECDRETDLVQAGIAAGVAAGTLRRLLDRMGEADLVVRRRRPPRRTVFVEFTENGFLRMTALLVELGAQAETGAET